MGGNPFSFLILEHSGTLPQNKGIGLRAGVSVVAPRFSASKPLTAIPKHSCDVRETLHRLIAFLFSRFYLNGTNSAKCTEEGRWSPELPVCARESLGPT